MSEISKNTITFDNIDSEKKDQLLMMLKRALNKFKRTHYYTEPEDTPFIDFYHAKSRSFYSYLEKCLEKNIKLTLSEFEKEIIQDINKFDDWFNSQEENKDIQTEYNKKYKFRNFKLGRHLITLAQNPENTLLLGTLFSDQDNDFKELSDQEKSLFKTFTSFFIKKISLEFLQEDIEAKIELKKIKEKFGFKSIVLESITSANYKLDYHYLNQWAYNVDKVLTEISQDLNIPFKFMSLNGELSLEYRKMDNIFSNTLGTFSDFEKTISLNFDTLENLKRTWIHEYTHALDSFCANKIAQNNDDSMKIFLSSYLLKSYLLNGKKDFNNEYINNLSENIIQLFYLSSNENIVKENNSKLKNFFEGISGLIAMELLNLNNKAYYELTEPQEIELSNIIDTTDIKAYIPLHFQTNENTLLKEVIHSFNVKIITNLKLHHEDHNLVSGLYKIRDNSYAEYNDLIVKIKSYIDNSGYALFENGNEYIGHFPDSNLYHNIKSDTISCSPSEKYYYLNPIEVFARQSENIYATEPNKKLLNNIYCYNLSQEEKEKTLKNINNMLSFLDLPNLDNDIKKNQNAIKTLLTNIQNQKNRFLNNQSKNLKIGK